MKRLKSEEYISPQVEIIEIIVEKGFALSGDNSDEDYSYVGGYGDGTEI